MWWRCIQMKRGTIRRRQIHQMLQCVKILWMCILYWSENNQCSWIFCYCVYWSCIPYKRNSSPLWSIPPRILLIPGLHGCAAVLCLLSAWSLSSGTNPRLEKVTQNIKSCRFCNVNQAVTICILKLTMSCVLSKHCMPWIYFEKQLQYDAEHHAYESVF